VQLTLMGGGISKNLGLSISNKIEVRRLLRLHIYNFTYKEYMSSAF